MARTLINGSLIDDGWCKDGDTVDCDGSAAYHDGADVDFLIKKCALYSFEVQDFHLANYSFAFDYFDVKNAVQGLKETHFWPIAHKRIREYSNTSCHAPFDDEDPSLWVVSIA
jgi:hypothetical protein